MKQWLSRALVLTVVASGAWAGEPAKPGVDYQVLTLEELLKVRIPTVSTASKTAEKATEAPATVVVITRNDIRLRGYRNLRDIFRDLPGMESIGAFYGEFGDLVPVRGVTGNNKIVALVNGMRVNPPGGEPMMFRADFAIADVEQIEVIYGPGSTLYGQDAISAVVNVITRKPEEKAFSASAEGGTLNRKEGSLSFARQVGAATVSAYVQYLDRDRTDISQEYPAEWQRNLAVAAPKGYGTDPQSWDCGTNAFLRVEAGNSSLQMWHRQSSVSSSMGQPPSFALVEEAVWKDMSTVLEAKNNLEMSSRTALESSLTFNRYEADPESRYVFDNRAGGWNMGDFKYALGYSASLEEKLTVKAGERFSLVGGLVGSHYDIVPKASIPGGADRHKDIVAQGGFFTYYTRKGDSTSRVDVARANDVVYQSLGAYLEGRFK
ncbi:MAG TPA: TonB-dependent receptor plug domain-containing protein, partial [Vicinamibacteria bacterium]